jgi:hypothetical protein
VKAGGFEESKLRVKKCCGAACGPKPNGFHSESGNQFEQKGGSGQEHCQCAHSHLAGLGFCFRLPAFSRYCPGMLYTTFGSIGARFSRLTGGLLVGAAVLTAPFQGKAAEEPRWESLFNGKDLAGWVVVHDANFIVTNQCLRLVGGMGWLRTEKPYTNFIFETEWRALEPGYDSGLFLRAGLEGKPWPKDAWQVNLLRTALGGLVKGFQTKVPAETPPQPVNQWVRMRIEVRGSKVSLQVNGEPAWEYDQLDAAGGYLGIQAENKAFEFRNLRLQVL